MVAENTIYFGDDTEQERAFLYPPNSTVYF